MMPIVRSDLSMSHPRVLRTASVTPQTRSTGAAKVRVSGSAPAAGTASASVIASNHAVRFIRVPPRDVGSLPPQPPALDGIDGARTLDGPRVVTHDHHRRTRARSRAQRAEDQGAVVVIEIAGRLVGEDERWIVEHGAAEGHALLLAP